MKQSVRVQDFIESHDVEDLLSFSNAENLFVFDLDNNLIETKQTLGSDQWFRSYYQLKVTNGLAAHEALHHTLSIYDEAHTKTTVKFTDERLPAILKQLVDEGNHLIALTTRGARIKEATVRQLNSLGVEFDAHCFPTHEVSLDDDSQVVFFEGIIFANGQDKGWCLDKLLQKASMLPKSIIFMDDHHKNVTSVINSMRSTERHCVGVRFRLLDFKQKFVNHDLSDIQIHAMKNLLTDEEAALIHAHREKKNKIGGRKRSSSI